MNIPQNSAKYSESESISYGLHTIYSLHTIIIILCPKFLALGSIKWLDKIIPDMVIIHK